MLGTQSGQKVAVLLDPTGAEDQDHCTGRILDMNVQRKMWSKVDSTGFLEVQEIQPCTVDFSSHFLLFPCTFP